MVRLKVIGKSESNFADIGFQFQYGSIKRFTNIALFNNHNLFQFQYGSIKREQSNSKETRKYLFQFQYGSIKSMHPNLYMM